MGIDDAHAVGPQYPDAVLLADLADLFLQVGAFFPSSLKPAVMMMTSLMPFFPASSRTEGTNVLGTVIMAKSMGLGHSSQSGVGLVAKDLWSFRVYRVQFTLEPRMRSDS
jgi:hypothetical protein